MSQGGLDEALQQAVRRRRLRVHYQPIISLGSGNIMGFEALARWHHEGRDIPPGEFIQRAEARDLIGAVDTLILQQACQQLRRWQAAELVSYDHFISVNVSGRVLRESGFPETIRAALQANRLAGSHLHLEIAAGFSDQADSEGVLAALHALGVICSLNDDGASVRPAGGDLPTLPVDILKLGRAAMSLDDERLRRLISRAHHRDMAVIAEGVEDESLLRRLLRLRCEYAQGFYFSPPVDALQAGRMLAGDPRWHRVVH